ncbi:phosphoribosylaminoimidazolesuccinocarboxamide synthase [Pyrobaculum neutrophilum]|uniref:Phosphoribosylaminoimidazole-succinocarboxamide synthase n=1 Tax=Pyrobaculum neutrophilum (strain DSM 2338 / JCM 9278 / NBRC 100436 / V24Sta) TaxID=444157 RepID=B1YBM1_PYRNV|nr:phosphoribosylaminoimidazolesuccinocarboxamide synthase [Pyrobaculum neutrophilum]ACB40823.1 Phosphoribosylaminoimidazolesuccinocarboxamide synthase [Pyrobaculum neutrophilum V24Sta]
MELVYEGKAKRVYAEGDILLLEFKDELTAFDGAKRDSAPGKGALAASLSALLFAYLRGRGVESHFIGQRGPNLLEVRRAQALPLEVIVRFRAYGSYLKRMPLVEPLRPFKKPLVELHLKDDRLHDPLILPQDAIEAGLVDEAELGQITDVAVRAGELLRDLYRRAGCDFIDVKFEFGRVGGRLVLIDEISGDTFRVLCGGEHLDKEYYRKTGDVRGLLERYGKLLEYTRLVLEAQ